MMITVSVIIPTFNRAHYLPEALDSVLSQSVSDVECIVVDDGSTDDTCALVERYRAADPRVRYLRQDNRGPSAARNHGIRVSRGRYIQFLDSDDVIVPGKFAKQLALLETSTAPALSFCDYRYCAHDDIDQTTTRDKLPPPRFVMKRPLWDIASRWETGLSIPIHCFLFDASFFRERRILFDENLGNHEDWDCWLRIFALDPIVHHVPEVLAIYRLHDSSICVDRSKLTSGFELAIRKQLDLFKHDSEMQSLLQRKLLELGTHSKETSSHKTVRINSSGFARLYRRSVPWPIQQFLSALRQRR